MQTEYLVHLEPPVLRAVGRELHKREEWILFVQYAVGREVQHASAGSEATKCRLRRVAPAQDLRIRSGETLDRRNFLTCPGQGRGPWRECQHTGAGRPRRAIPERNPYRRGRSQRQLVALDEKPPGCIHQRSEEHTSELQSRPHLVCRLLLEKKKTMT